MLPTRLVDPEPPLLSSPKGMPWLHRVLGATFHLEALGPDDAAPLAEVQALVHGWIGEALRWSTSTTFPLLDPYRREDLDYVPAYADTIRPPPPSDDLDRRFAENVLFAATFGDFTLLATGCEEGAFASPYSYAFSSVVRQDRPGGDAHTCAMLRVTVPASWPAGDFHERACAIAARLRLRWGSAGLTYSFWETSGFNAVRAAIYAHSRRHWGYDMAQWAAYLPEWHHEVRTANWITFLGEAFAARVRAAAGEKALEGGGDLHVAPVGTSVLLRAGERPEEGDINRRIVPPGYVQADEAIRAVRAGAGIDFRSPWDRSSSEQWLRRFETKVG